MVDNNTVCDGDSPKGATIWTACFCERRRRKNSGDYKIKHEKDGDNYDGQLSVKMTITTMMDRITA